MQTDKTTSAVIDESMAELHHKLDNITRRTTEAAMELDSPFEACQKMRARKLCPGYVYYPETDSEAFFCSDHCACRRRIFDALKARRAAALHKQAL